MLGGSLAGPVLTPRAPYRAVTRASYTCPGATTAIGSWSRDAQAAGTEELPNEAMWREPEPTTQESSARFSPRGPTRRVAGVYEGLRSSRDRSSAAIEAARDSSPHAASRDLARPGSDAGTTLVMKIAPSARFACRC